MFESIVVDFFFMRTSGVLFHIEGPVKESAFCSMLVFRKGQINFR